MSSGVLYSFYKTREWRQVREYVIHKYNGMCPVSGDRGDVVHHILPIDISTVNNPKYALNPYNLILLNRVVHEKIHQRKNTSCKDGLCFNGDGNMVSAKPDTELEKLLKQIITTKQFDRKVFDRIHELAGV
jgi:hypothetical protein